MACGISLISFGADAGRIDCGFIAVKNLYVQSDRSDGGDHNNKLLVQLGQNDCPAYGYVSNDEPAYDGILSMLLAAKMSDKTIRVVVNDGPQLSGAAKIEWVNFN